MAPRIISRGKILKTASHVLVKLVDMSGAGAVWILAVVM